MKKIPTLFKRDEETHRVINEVNPVCQWVLDGEGTPTRKWDGTCCKIEDGILYKRREVKKDKREPSGFILVEEDQNTGKKVGWIKVDFDDPENKYHKKAWLLVQENHNSGTIPKNGTYELLGSKIQGNPEHMEIYVLLEHGQHEESRIYDNINEGEHPDFDWLELKLDDLDIEGVVWHHSDGRMAKIKGKDYGLKR